MRQTTNHLKSGSPCQRIQRPIRRGSLYLPVMGAAMIVSAIGMSAMVVARLNLNSVSRQQERSEARMLADSAVELGVSILTQDANWRTTLQNNQEYPSDPP